MNRTWLKMLPIMILVVLGLVSSSRWQNYLQNQLKINHESIEHKDVNGLDQNQVGQMKSSDAMIVEQSTEVLPDILWVTRTISTFAHGQDLFWVEGKFKQKLGELYLTLVVYDEKGNLMKSMDFGTPEEIKPIDDEWSLFRHKMVEDTGKVQEINKVTIKFKFRGKSTELDGKLDVPVKKPDI